MQLVLGTHEHVAHHHPIEPGRTTRCSRASRPTCAPTAARSRTPARPAHDRSIQIHSCHGRARQVEILRDAILHLLDEDDTLQPRDVIVMCPDIESFAPLIQATFGAGEVVDDEFEPLPEELRPTDLRVRLADRSLRQTNPVLGVVAQLIDLAGRRADRLRRARPRRPRARPPPLPPRRRGPRADPRLGRRQRHPLGPRRRPSRPVQARGPARRHLEGGPRPRARRRDDDRGGPPAVRGRPAGRRRREPRHRPRRPHGRARRPRCRRRSTPSPPPSRSASGCRRSPTAADALTATSQRDAWQRAQLERILGDVVSEAAARRRRAHPARGPRAARRAAPGPPDARELPHRPPDDLHARPDALGAAPGRLPARPRRRGVPAQGARATATTSCSPTRTSATATRAPRTARCCSTR